MSTIPPTVAHLKDHFLPLSETFIYRQLVAHQRYRPIVLDRFARQNETIFPFDAHHSPAIRGGRIASTAERAALRWAGRSPWLERVIRQERVQLLHAHFGQVGALWAPVATRQQLPLVTSFYGIDLSVFARAPAWQGRFAMLWEAGRFFVALGPHMAAQLVALGADPTRVEVLPLIVDPTQFEAGARPPPVEGVTRLLTVGRLIPKKGTAVLLRALAALREKHRFELAVVGDGPLRADLQRLSESLMIADQVRFLGWLSPAEVATQMAEAHLFVLPSHRDPDTGESEGSPTVLLEAQACSLPVVSTSHADIPFIVDEGHSGLLVPEADSTALAAALDSLMAHPDRWAEMGAAGRARIARQHAPSVVGEQLEQLYDRALR